MADSLSAVVPDPPVESANQALGELDPKRWLILALAGLGQLMVVLDATIVTIALPHAQSALGFSSSDRQWVITAYSLAFGGLLVLGGRLADIFGRKRIFILGAVGFGVASALGGLAQNFAMLVSARAAQGAFGALLAPATLSLLSITFKDPKERGTAYGIYGAIAGSGAAIGLILGGALTQFLDWRWCLYVNVIMAAASVAGAVWLLAESRSSADTHIDIPGTALSVGGLVAIVYGFSNAATNGWTAPLTIGLLLAGVALLSAFVVVERAVAHPLVPMRVIVDRIRGGSYLTIALLSIGLFGVFLFLTYFLQNVMGYHALLSGVSFMPMVLGVILASTTGTTVLLPRFGPRALVVAGSLLGGLGMLYLTQLKVGSGYWSAVAPAIFVVGIGMGTVFGAVFNLGTVGTTQEDAGVASALVNVGQQVGGAIGTALLNTIAVSATKTFVKGHVRGPASATHMHLVLNQAQVHGFDVGFAVSVALFAATALAAFAVFPRGRLELSPEELALAGV